MKYYIDIQLLADSEVNLGFIWEKIYLQVHLALVEMKDKDGLVAVGISFPSYQEGNFPLGDVLRVFAHSKEELEKLSLDSWLKKLDDYLSMSEVNEVPISVNEFVTFSRKQFKTNVERLARRQAKRKGISYEEALKNYGDFKEDKTKLPFIMMKSLSTDNQMKIFIEKSVQKESKEGLFSTYGLSKTATVPWF